MANYQFDIKYHPGAHKIDADVLSRHPDEGGEEVYCRDFSRGGPPKHMAMQCLATSRRDPSESGSTVKPGPASWTIQHGKQHPQPIKTLLQKWNLLKKQEGMVVRQLPDEWSIPSRLLSLRGNGWRYGNTTTKHITHRGREDPIYILDVSLSQ